MQLRKYQRDAIDSIYKAWETGLEGNFLVVCPTGSGKSVICANLVKELHENWSARILILTHTREIISQNAEKILVNWPMAPIGIYSAGLNRKDKGQPITIAGIQSIAKNIHNFDPFDICIVDECHLIDTDENTRYKKTLDTLQLMNPKMRILGLTASPFRLKQGWIHKGDDRIFHHIVYDIKIQELIDLGFLSNLVPFSGSVTIDTTGIHSVGGDFKAGELEEKAMEGDTTIKAVEDLIERGKNRKCWLVFSCGTKHSEQIADALNARGIHTEIITGETTKATRDRIIREHKEGQLKCIVNCAVLTTGFDNPRVDLIGMIRPTKSPSLYLQICGRGMRICPEKKDCLFIDYSGVALALGPIDSLDPDNKVGGNGLPPSKECPDCMAIIAAGCLICPVCGHKFPEPKPVIYSAPVEAPVLKSQIQPRELDVFGVKYEVHQKEGSANSVKIEYMCGIMWVKEWIFPEAGSDRALYFFRKFMAEAGATRTYRTAQEVENDPPPCPTKIWVIKDGRFDRVVKREYAHGA